MVGKKKKGSSWFLATSAVLKRAFSAPIITANPNHPTNHSSNHSNRTNPQVLNHPCGASQIKGLNGDGDYQQKYVNPSKPTSSDSKRNRWIFRFQRSSSSSQNQNQNQNQNQSQNQKQNQNQNQNQNHDRNPNPKVSRNSNKELLPAAAPLLIGADDDQKKISSKYGGSQQQKQQQQNQAMVAVAAAAAEAAVAAAEAAAHVVNLTTPSLRHRHSQEPRTQNDIAAPKSPDYRHSHSHSHSHNHPPHHHHHYHHPNSFNIRATSKKIDYNSNNQLCRSEKSSSIKIQTREARSVAEEASRIAAAIRIQAAFRGFLVRRDLQAFMRQKRLALWRTNRRKAADFSDLSAERQASSALRYVQALMKTNAAAAEGRWRSNPNLPSLAAIHHSMNSTDSHTSYGSHSFNPSSTAHRRSGDRDAEWASAGVADDEDLRDGRQEWDDRMQTLEQIKAMEKAKREAAMKRERAMAYAFSSQQTVVRQRNWLERWMATRRPWEARHRRRRSPPPPLPVSRWSAPVTPREGILLPPQNKPFSAPPPRGKPPVHVTPAPRGKPCGHVTSPPPHQIRGVSHAAGAGPSYMAPTESARAKLRPDTAHELLLLPRWRRGPASARAPSVHSEDPILRPSPATTNTTTTTTTITTKTNSRSRDAFGYVSDTISDTNSDSLVVSNFYRRRRRHRHLHHNHNHY